MDSSGPSSAGSQAHNALRTGRELDLYGDEPLREAEPPPAASGAPVRELDLYEGVGPAPLGLQLAERPRRTDGPTDPPEARSLGGGDPAPIPGWFHELWGLFPQVVRERYRPAGVIGEGGMGIVLEAEDRLMDRHVAIKGLRDPAGATVQQRARQAEEARLTARLSHPNILPIYDVWRDAHGNQWYSMMRVPGENPTLARYWKELCDCVCVEDRPLSKLLQTFVEICRAVAYAHSCGIVHRDLKPENIFLGANGAALVADWGVALDLRSSAPSGGSLVGTQGYSAPEQLGAFGKPWSDERSDIFGLGVILFELLVSRSFTSLPTASSSRPRPLVAGRREIEIPERVPRELAAIIRKATAWEPAERHSSVDALINELHTYQNGGLLEGLSYTRKEKVFKWARQHPLRAAVAAVAALIGFQALATIVYVGMSHRREAELQRSLLAKAQHKQAQMYAEKSAAASLARSPDAAVHYAALSLSLCPPDRSLPTPTAYTLAAGSRGLGRLIWTRKLDSVSHSLAFHPDGYHVATAGLDGWIEIRDVAARTGPLRLAHPGGWAQCAAYDSKGSRLVTAGQDGVVRIWDPGTGKPLGELKGHRGPVLNLACASDGSVISAGEDGTVRRWDARGAEVWKREQKLSGPRALAVHPRATHVALATAEGTVSLWSLETGEQLNDVPGSQDRPSGLVFSPDGRTLAWSTWEPPADAWVVIFDLEKWAQLGQFDAHQQPVTALAYSGDGRVLASGSDDMKIRVWPLETGRLGLELTGHADAVTGLAFSPDGRTLGSVGQDATLRLWDIQTGPAVENSEMLKSAPTCLVFHPDGERLAGADDKRQVRVWDVLTRLELGKTAPERDDVQDVAFLGDGSTVVYRTTGGDEVRWDPVSNEQTRRKVTHSSRICRLVPIGGGRVLAATAWEDKFELADLAGGPKLVLPGGEGHVTTLDVSPDGKVLAMADAGAMVSLRDAATGKELRQLKSRLAGHDRVRFSPDGRWLARAGGARELQIWDLTDCDRKNGELQGLSSRVHSFAFAPKGCRIAAGTKDGEIVIWDLERWLVERHDPQRAKEPQRMAIWARLRGHEHGVKSLAFSPDGRWLASGSYDGRMRLWELSRLERPAEFLKSVGRVSPLTLSDVELLVDGRPVPETPSFPADHPFHWLESARAGDTGARMRAGRLMRASWRPQDGLPLNWDEDARRLLE